MNNKMTILGIAGSLRKGSYNNAVLNAAEKLVPEDTELKIFRELGEIPLFNQDEESTPSSAVMHLKEQVRSADAILFATPEYNYSFPGVLKNAIDWASRPYGDSAWDGKPVAITSASTGMLGGSRAQYQLRQVFIFLNMFPLNKPEVIIPDVNQKVDRQGVLTDEHTRLKIAELLTALAEWTQRLKEEIILPSEAEEKEKYEYEKHYGRSQQQ